MVDYRKFLGKQPPVVAPYLGGATIELSDRRLRLSERPAVQGWYSFEVTGRSAKAIAAAEAPDLSGLPRVRGFTLEDRLVTEGARAPLLSLLPEEESPLFSPVAARVWPGGALIFEQLEFESGVEGTLREAFSVDGSISEVKAVPASLRAAWAFAIGQRASRRLNIPASPLELRPHLARIVNGEVETVVRELAAERERQARDAREAERLQQALLAHAELEAARRARGPQHFEERAFTALDKAGAQLESARRLAGGTSEVIFRFMNDRFVTVVNTDTLQIIDSGICLSGSDRVLTLDSLPGVIEEAIETDALVVTRWP